MLNLAQNDEVAHKPHLRTESTVPIGALGLSLITITVIAIVMACLLVLAGILYFLDLPIPGLAVHFTAFVLYTVLMATWFTSLDWHEWGPFPIIMAIMLLMVVTAPLIAAADG